MKNIICSLLLLTLCVSTMAQTTVTGDRVVARQSFYLLNKWVDSIQNDVNFINRANAFPTSDAVYRFVTGRIADVSVPVTSVFGRVGNITANSSDYSSYYPLLSGSYSNPSWITSLAWSKISGTPTTLAGYGITDGGGVNAVGSIGAGDANGMSISGSTIRLHEATGTHGGVLSNGTQTIGGYKKFNNTLQANTDFYVGKSSLEGGNAGLPTSYQWNSDGTLLWSRSVSNDGTLTWRNNAVASKMQLTQDGQLTLPGYVAGTFTATGTVTPLGRTSTGAIVDVGGNSFTSTLINAATDIAKNVGYSYVNSTIPQGSEPTSYIWTYVVQPGDISNSLVSQWGVFVSWDGYKVYGATSLESWRFLINGVSVANGGNNLGATNSMNGYAKCENTNIQVGDTLQLRLWSAGTGFASSVYNVIATLYPIRYNSFKDIVAVTELGTILPTGFSYSPSAVNLANPVIYDAASTNSISLSLLNPVFSPFVLRQLGGNSGLVALGGSFNVPGNVIKSIRRWTH